MRRTFGPESVTSGKSVTPSFRHSMSMGKSPSVTVQTARKRLPRVRFLGKVKDSTTGATEQQQQQQQQIVQFFVKRCKMCAGAAIVRCRWVHEWVSARKRKKEKRKLIEICSSKWMRSVCYFFRIGSVEFVFRNEVLKPLSSQMLTTARWKVFDDVDYRKTFTQTSSCRIDKTRI